MRNTPLELTAFFSWFIILTYEVIGARILGPYFGTSTFVWTAMIGIILMSLSLGYTLWGKLSDREDARHAVLSDILTLASLTLAFTAIFYTPILTAISWSIPDIRIGSIISGLILFAPASILLGMVSPYATRLRIEHSKDTGKTIGYMSALATFGSIFGTFLTGFYLLPYFGVRHIVSALPILLLALTWFLSPRRHSLFRIGLCCLYLSFAYGSYTSSATALSREVDTLYSHIRVENLRNQYTGERLRMMKINAENHSLMSLDSDRLVNEYTKYYHLVRHFVPDFSRVLMLGGAGYSFPKSYLATYPEKKIEVVEIDPWVTQLAEQYFSLSHDSDLTIHHADARVFLNQNRQKYDAILGDAFSSWYSLPYQLTTREAVQHQYDSLTETGGVILNIISSVEGETGEFLRAEYHTWKEIFPQVYVFLVNAPNDPKKIQNIIMIALKSQTEPNWHSDDPEIQRMLSHLWTRDIPDDMPRITDDFAPVDHYVNKLLGHL